MIPQADDLRDLVEVELEHKLARHPHCLLDLQAPRTASPRAGALTRIIL